MTIESAASSSVWEDFQSEIKNELEQSQRALKEVTLMLVQSQAELTKLTQKNASISMQLQQVQSQIETMPREDIRVAYTQAMDAQQRLLVMRAQLEKLQNDETALKKYVILLGKIDGFLGEGPTPPRGGRRARNGSEMLEKVISAQEAERQRLSRQMHDGPAQALSNFIVQAEIAARLFEMDPAKAKEELNLLKTAAMGTFQKVRTFIAELRPMSLDDLGLVPTLRRYMDAFKEETGLDVSFNLKGMERRLEPYLEVMIFRAVQELMGNVVRHNGDLAGRVQINVQVAIEENLVRVSVADNGKGFKIENLATSNGFGLKLIRERVEMLGGFVNIESTPGQGSKITFQIPVEAGSLVSEIK